MESFTLDRLLFMVTRIPLVTFMAKTAENLNPAFDLLRSIPFADTLKSVLGKKELEEKKAETTEFEEVK